MKLSRSDLLAFTKLTCSCVLSFISSSMVLDVKYWYKTGTVEYSSYYSQATSSLKRAKIRENSLALIKEVDNTLKTSPVLQLKTVYHMTSASNTIKIIHFSIFLFSSVEIVQYSNLVFL